MIRYTLIALVSIFCFACSTSENRSVKDNNAEEEQIAETAEVNSPGIPARGFMLDVENSSIVWIGRKPTGEHRGTVKFLHGAMSRNEDGSVVGVIESDMNTIVCTDIEDKDDNLDLVNHLKDKDFFNVADFPTCSMEITEYQEAIDDKSTVRIGGDITIKGTKQHFVIDVVETTTKDSLILNGVFQLDRTLFGIEYKSKSIFPNLKDKFIEDDIELDVNLRFSDIKMLQKQ